LSCRRILDSLKKFEWNGVHAQIPRDNRYVDKHSEDLINIIYKQSMGS